MFSRNISTFALNLEISFIKKLLSEKRCIRNCQRSDTATYNFQSYICFPFFRVKFQVLRTIVADLSVDLEEKNSGES